MALTHFELGTLYKEKGGALERRFLGAALHMTQQILFGGYPNPTQAQVDWANMLVGMDCAEHEREAREAMEWALANNSSVQNDPLNCLDADLSFVVAEYAKTYLP